MSILITLQKQAVFRNRELQRGAVEGFDLRSLALAVVGSVVLLLLFASHRQSPNAEGALI